MGLFSYSKQEEVKLKIKQVIYYFIIALVSVVALVVLPLLNSKADLKFEFPNSPMGWIVYIITRLSIAVINILFYICFMAQAKINIREDAKYKEAKLLLEKANIEHDRKPMSPAKWTAKQYTTKSLTLALTSILSTIALTHAIISFELEVFLAYLLTVFAGLIFGFIQMKKAEDYWTDEFYEYALLAVKSAKNKSENVDACKISSECENAEKSANLEAKEQNNDKCRWESSSEPSGTSLEEQS